MAYLEINPQWIVNLELDGGTSYPHSNGVGYSGEWARLASNNDTEETLLRFILDDLLFSTIDSVELDANTDASSGSPGANTLNLFRQDKGDYYYDWSNPPVFSDFAQTAWATLLSSIAWNGTGIYTVPNSVAFKNHIQAANDWGKDNDGMILHIPFNVKSQWVRVAQTNTKLKVTYTPPTNTVWGCRYVISQETSVSNARLMGGVSPNLDNMVIKSISMPVGTFHAEQLRLAVYTGGSLDNPAGATLLYDFGVTSGSGTNQWLTINHPGSGVAWPKNTNTWLAWKANGGVTDITFSGESGINGDMQSARGRFSSSSMNTDENTAFEASVPSGGSFTNFWYPIVIQYAIETPSIETVSASVYKGILRGVNRGIL